MDIGPTKKKVMQVTFFKKTKTSLDVFVNDDDVIEEPKKIQAQDHLISPWQIRSDARIRIRLLYCI